MYGYSGCYVATPFLNNGYLWPGNGAATSMAGLTPADFLPRPRRCWQPHPPRRPELYGPR